MAAGDTLTAAAFMRNESCAMFRDKTLLLSNLHQAAARAIQMLPMFQFGQLLKHMPLHIRAKGCCLQRAIARPTSHSVRLPGARTHRKVLLRAQLHHPSHLNHG
jgi:hypothetical protein